MELFPFNIFVGKGLYDPDAGQRILKGCIDIPDFLPVIQEGGLHPFILAGGKEDHQKDYG